MSRLTKKKQELDMYVFDRETEYATFCDGIALLQIVGKFEDIMEKYEINSIEELEEILKDYDKMAKDVVEMAIAIGRKVDLNNDKRKN